MSELPDCRIRLPEADDDNKVISIATRKPLAASIIEAEEAAAAKAAEVEAEISAAHKRSIDNQLAAIDELRRLTEMGKLSTISVVAQLKDQPLIFYSDLIFDEEGIDPNDAQAFIGHLELIKMELAECGFMAVTVTADGDLTGPNIQFYEEDDEDDEYE